MISGDIISDTALDFALGSVIGLISWFFGGLDGLLKILLVLIIIDYFSGLSIAWINRTISSSAGFKGITKKCIMLTFVGIAHLMDTIIPDDGGAMRSIVCLFYIANEGKSIIENANNLGIPIPQMLLKHFNNIHKDDEPTKKNSKINLHEIKN